MAKELKDLDLPLVLGGVRTTAKDGAEVIVESYVGVDGIVRVRVIHPPPSQPPAQTE